MNVHIPDESFMDRLAHVVTKTRLIDTGEATEILVPATVDAAQVAWMLHDWTDSCVIEVRHNRIIRVIKK